MSRRFPRTRSPTRSAARTAPSSLPAPSFNGAAVRTARALLARSVRPCASATGFGVREVSREDAIGGLATRVELDAHVHFDRAAEPLVFGLLAWIPKSRNPCPAFLGLNIAGNQSVSADPAVRLSRGWAPYLPEIGLTEHRASAASPACTQRAGPSSSPSREASPSSRRTPETSPLTFPKARIGVSASAGRAADDAPRDRALGIRTFAGSRCRIGLDGIDPTRVGRLDTRVSEGGALGGGTRSALLLRRGERLWARRGFAIATPLWRDGPRPERAFPALVLPQLPALQRPRD